MGLDMRFIGLKRNRRRMIFGGRKVPLGEMVNLGYFRGCWPLHYEIIENSPLYKNLGTDLNGTVKAVNSIGDIVLYEEDIESILESVSDMKEYKRTWNFGKNKVERKKWDEAMDEWTPDIKRTLNAILKWMAKTGTDKIIYESSW